MQLFEALTIVEGWGRCSSVEHHYEAWQVVVEEGLIWVLSEKYQLMAEKLLDKNVIVHPPHRNPPYLN